MQIPPFVSLYKYGLWSHERTHSITTAKILLKFHTLVFRQRECISSENRSDEGLMFETSACLTPNLLFLLDNARLLLPLRAGINNCPSQPRGTSRVPIQTPRVSHSIVTYWCILILLKMFKNLPVNSCTEFCECRLQILSIQRVLYEWKLWMYELTCPRTSLLTQWWKAWRLEVSPYPSR